MRFLPPANSNRQAHGFTLVELLVIAPIAIIVIAGFIVLMMAIVGNVMVTHDENRAVYDTSAALDTVEQDVRLSTQFLTATTGVVSPQGTANNFAGAGNFTNGSNTLILQTLATNKNPRDTTRQLVYYANQPDPCGSLTSQSHIFALNVVYFVKDNALWRRTIVPPNNRSSPANSTTTCSAPWQLNSCSPGQTAALCASEDMLLVRNVSSLTVEYLSTPSSTTPLTAAEAPSAAAVKLTLSTQKTTAGRDVKSNQVLVTSKMNMSSSTVGPT